MKARKNDDSYPLDGWKGSPLRSGLIGYHKTIQRKGRTVIMAIAPVDRSHKAWRWSVGVSMPGPAHDRQGEASSIAEAVAAARTAGQAVKALI